MLDDEVRFHLEQEDSQFHDRVLTWATARIKASQNHLSQRWDRWREAEQLYRCFREPDANDKEVRGQAMTLGVQKVVVPFTYATIQSILAWQIDFFTQRKPMVPVEGLTPDDARKAICHEHLLEFQGDRMAIRMPLVLLQQFLDAEIYGLGIAMNGWTVREYLGFKRSIKPVSFGGQVVGYDDELVEEDIVEYEGNQVTNVLPYDWFPDPRLPVARFQEGEFCGHRTERSHTALRVQAREGLYAGIQWIPDSREETGRGMLGGGGSESELGRTMGVEHAPSLIGQVDEDGKPYRALHHLWAYVPSSVLRLEGMGRDDLPRMWVITVANLSRVIRVERANLPGRKFPFSAIEVNYNLHSPMNPGMVEIMSGPQYHLSWLINSRMANVRRSLNFELIYDPSLIEEKDLTRPNAAGLIRLKQAAFHSGATLDQIVKQMPATDVTAGHMADARAWADLIEQITGANRMIQGLSNTGRRAATEVQASLGLASGRMKLMSLIASCQGLQDMFEQQIANNTAFLNERVTTRLYDPYRDLLQADYLEISPEDLQGIFRVPLLEQGVPTDKVFHANVLRELLGLFMQNPQSAMVLAGQVNGSEIVATLLKVLGIRNQRDFFLRPEQAQQQAQMASMLAQVAQITAQPDEQVSRQVERGNLVPMDRPPTETMPNTGMAGATMGM